MPFIDLPNEHVSMFYRTNLPPSPTSPSLPLLDRTKPTLLLLPGTILDSSDMDELLSSAPLRTSYNLLALDPRSIGRTVNPPSECRDAWMDAADYVKALDVLGVGRAHVFAVSGGSVASAKRMAILWPERCESLTLVAIQTPEIPKWVDECWAELVQTYLSAPDLDTMEECINDIYPFAFGDFPCAAKIDAVAEYWETQYPPTRATRFYDFALPHMFRERLPPSQLGMIRCPVLLMNGDSVIVSSPTEARAMQAALVNARGGAVLHIIPGAPDQFHYLPQFAPAAIDHLLHFLGSLPPPSTSSPPSSSSSSDDDDSTDSMRRALDTLAHIKSDPSLAARDPSLSSSFSCVPPEHRAVRRQTFADLREREKSAFDPLGPNGEPPRKFSERNAERGVRESKRPRSDSALWVQGIEVSNQVHDTQAALEKIQAVEEEIAALLIEERKTRQPSDERTAALERLAELTREKDVLLREKSAYADSDPQHSDCKTRAGVLAREAAERFTDNVLATLRYLETRGLDSSAEREMFGLGKGWEDLP